MLRRRAGVGLLSLKQNHVSGILRVEELVRVLFVVAGEALEMGFDARAVAGQSVAELVEGLDTQTKF